VHEMVILLVGVGLTLSMLLDCYFSICNIFLASNLQPS
jgi:hypothetical protein